MKPLILPVLLILFACGTPQEQCIAGSTRDARVVNDLIRETEANLARGYALETGIEMKPDWIDCTPTPTRSLRLRLRLAGGDDCEARSYIRHRGRSCASRMP